MQPSLSLQINQRTALVTVDTARAVRGVDTESILAEIESGNIRWVFDIALPGAARRELRIWASSLIAPEFKHAEADVLRAVLGTTRDTLRGAQVAQLLLCSYNHVQRLHDLKLLTGAIIGHTRQIQTASLGSFLRSRLVS